MINLYKAWVHSCKEVPDLTIEFGSYRRKMSPEFSADLGALIPTLGQRSEFGEKPSVGPPSYILPFEKKKPVGRNSSPRFAGLTAPPSPEVEAGTSPIRTGSQSQETYA